jgi:hypothetical protein
MLFVRAQIAAGRPLIDPRAPILASCVAGDVQDDVGRFLSLGEVFQPALAQSHVFGAAVRVAHAALRIDPLKALL